MKYHSNCACNQIAPIMVIVWREVGVIRNTQFFYTIQVKILDTFKNENNIKYRNTGVTFLSHLIIM
jgi:hypothetical protein